MTVYCGRPALSSTAIGLRCKDGVVLAVEKIVQSKLLTPGANRRIQTADMHIGVVCHVIVRRALLCEPIVMSCYVNVLSYRAGPQRK